MILLEERKRVRRAEQRRLIGIPGIIIIVDILRVVPVRAAIRLIVVGVVLGVFWVIFVVLRIRLAFDIIFALFVSVPGVGLGPVGLLSLTCGFLLLPFGFPCAYFRMSAREVPRRLLSYGTPERDPERLPAQMQVRVDQPIPPIMRRSEDQDVLQDLIRQRQHPRRPTPTLHPRPPLLPNPPPILPHPPQHLPLHPPLLINHPLQHPRPHLHHPPQLPLVADIMVRPRHEPHARGRPQRRKMRRQRVPAVQMEMHAAPRRSTCGCPVRCAARLADDVAAGHGIRGADAPAGDER
ncbi:uncharacterized protein EV422DRAFT_518667 [Fimicolochytrium jonesii]|uniref:uncharacterized protein n=1 Tax=Fimicolochytrium jonesii TaxID=1396493 RepID=UPI0022FF36F0|nr:uncharacterized protein EV422DRAFT_518667 [Fimicolochytrium jonesii]KAI8824030.1 hypothetical protein EV422DRAFT_518667 [Fimicolochytrium jonesii]